MCRVENILYDSVSKCIESLKDCSSKSYFVLQLNAQNTQYHSKLRLFIVKLLSTHLLKKFPNLIKDIRIYGSTMEYNACTYSDIDIIIKTNRLNSLLLVELKKIDKSLSEQYCLLLNIKASDWCYMLDAHIINDSPKSPVNPSNAYLEHIYSYEACAV